MPVWVCVYHMHQVTWKPEEAFGCPVAGVTDGWELPDVSSGN